MRRLLSRPLLAVLQRGALLGLLAHPLGCSRRAVESWLSRDEPTVPRASLFEEAEFRMALPELRRRAPGTTGVLSLLVYGDHAVLQAEDATLPGRILQHVYREGQISAPVPVKLLGTGALADNLFPLDTVKLDALPELVRAAREHANIPEGTVARVLLRRNLPETADVQFHVFVTSQRRDARIDADQNATLLEPVSK